MKIVELTPQDFDVYAKDHELANPWQTSNFGNAATALGYSTMYLGFEDGLAIKGVTLLLTKNVYLGQSVSYAPRGPLLDYEDYSFAEEALLCFAPKLNCVADGNQDTSTVLSFPNVIDCNLTCVESIFVTITSNQFIVPL